MMSCKEYQEVLLNEKIEEIQEPMASQLAEHLEQCPLCLSEAESFEPLVAELRDLPLPDPGELFFRRQLKSINQQIEAEAPRRNQTKSFRPWYASLVAAAAVLLLFIGYSRWAGHSDDAWKQDWKNALNFLAEDSDPELLPLDLEELNGPELDRVARGIVEDMFEDLEKKAEPSSDDWMDLNGDEMDDLLHRLQVEEGRKAS